MSKDQNNEDPIYVTELPPIPQETVNLDKALESAATRVTQAQRAPHALTKSITFTALEVRAMAMLFGVMGMEALPDAEVPPLRTALVHN